MTKSNSIFIIKIIPLGGDLNNKKLDSETVLEAHFCKCKTNVFVNDFIWGFYTLLCGKDNLYWRKWTLAV